MPPKEEAKLTYTSLSELDETIATLRQTFTAGTTLPISYRKHQLLRLHALFAENESLLKAALVADLRKSDPESLGMEIRWTMSEIAHAYRRLDGWAKPERLKMALGLALSRAEVRKEPLGLALIIGPWNFPLQLVIAPLIGAIAAGNVAIIKPSEISTHTCAIVERLLPLYLDSSAYRVVVADGGTTKAMLERQFDYIFFTGGIDKGREVAVAAAKHLTPVTLELGPAILLPDANIEVAARRIACGKTTNAGQFCLAPDYALIPSSRLNAFLSAYRSTLKDFFGDDAQLSKNFGRIINAGHFDRIASTLGRFEVVMGGKVDRNDLYVEPTVVKGILEEEVFAPVLYVLAYESIDEAVEIARKYPNPLALYIFGSDQPSLERLHKAIPSGAVVYNDTFLHAAVATMPFGGVGTSGMGRYHGVYSFKTFTHERGVFLQSESSWVDKVMSMRYPPYGENLLGFYEWLVFEKIGTFWRWFW